MGWRIFTQELDGSTSVLSYLTKFLSQGGRKGIDKFKPTTQLRKIHMHL